MRLGGGDRTKEIPVAEWERVYRMEALEKRLLHQARVLGWGKEKRFYYAHKRSWMSAIADHNNYAWLQQVRLENCAYRR